MFFLYQTYISVFLLYFRLILSWFSFLLFHIEYYLLLIFFLPKSPQTFYFFIYFIISVNNVFLNPNLTVIRPLLLFISLTGSCLTTVSPSEPIKTCASIFNILKNASGDNDEVMVKLLFSLIIITSPAPFICL